MCTAEDAYRCFMGTELDHLVLGSFVLTPLGTVIAAPVAAVAGIDNALLIAAGAITALNLAMLLIPSVWSIREREVATTMAAA